MFFDIFTNISIYFKQYKLDNITLYIIKLLYNSGGKNENKGMLVILIIMFIIAVTGGVVGFLESKKNKPDTPNDNKAGTITYKYFLEDEEVNEMPVNEKTIDENGMEVTNEIYAFSRFNCNPSLTGDFNTEEWKFVPAEEIESTCELYFVKAKYEVTITEPINATLDVNNPKYINREEMVHS